MSVPDLHAVVPAGGAGTRLWPLSRAAVPKFLLDLTGSGRSLLQQTWDRLLPLVGPDRVVVVTGTAHADRVREQLPDLPAASLLGEPSPKDSMAAIGLAAAVLHRRDPDALLGSFAADHVVTDPAAFAETVRQAAEAAREGWVTTIGITPTHPSTGFGYVREGDPLALPGAPLARRAQAFVEKPDLERARGYLADGGYRWNAGMFVVRTSVLLDHLARLRPALHEGLVEIAAAWDTPDRERVLARTWSGLEKVAIDHAVAEPVAAEGGVAVVPGSFGWDDVGDVAALAGILAAAGAAAGGAGAPGDAAVDGGVRVLGDPAQVLAEDASGLVVPGSGRLVALLGLQDVVVVDTPDAVLATTPERAQDVRRLVEALRAAGRHDLL